MTSACPRLTDAENVGGDRFLLVVGGEVERRQDLADLLEAVQVDGADLGQVEGLAEYGLDGLIVPGRSLVRADRQQQRLRRAGLGFGVVEGQSGGRAGA